jgi:hypothetical protein
MKKSILIVLFLFSFSNAEYLFFSSASGSDETTFIPICIDDYYFENGSVNILMSSNQMWLESTITTQNFGLNDLIYSGYKYDSINDRCIPDPLLEYYGLNFYDYNALLALMGLLIGFVLLSTITYLFVRK